jgi:hypothetical protein
MRPVTGLLLLAGFGLNLCSMLGGKDGVGVFLSFIGLIVWMVGCFALTNDLGVSPAWGFLGLLTIVGVLLIYLVSLKGSRRKKDAHDHEYPWEKSQGKTLKEKERERDSFDY